LGRPEVKPVDIWHLCPGRLRAPPEVSADG